MSEVRILLRLWGDVQGVSLRWMIQRKAVQLGLRGYVKNVPNGSVEVGVIGEKEKINSLIEWFKLNPGYSQISRIDKEDDKIIGDFNDFTILFR